MLKGETKKPGYIIACKKRRCWCSS